jgi:hypothetical protein
MEDVSNSVITVSIHRMVPAQAAKRRKIDCDQIDPNDCLRCE